MDSLDPRTKFFAILTFGIVYGTILTALTSNYYVSLEDAYYTKLDCPNVNWTLANASDPEIEKKEDFCSVYFSKWRDCSIVGIFVGVFILVASLGTIFYLYIGSNEYERIYEFDEDEQNRSLVPMILVVILGVVMIMAVFGVLIDSHADTFGLESAPGLESSAVAAIVALGFAVAVPCLGVIGLFILLPLFKCLSDVKDWCN